MSETIIMKTCTKCHNILPLSEYYEDNRGKYGRFARCKPCCAQARKDYRATPRGREISNKLARKYSQTEGARHRRRRYKDTEKAREANRKYQNKRYQQEDIKVIMKAKTARRKKLFPERTKAVAAVYEAVRRKLLAKPTSLQCPCGRKAGLYHHTQGYEPEHWFDVAAICYSCHTKIHKRGFLSSRTG